MLARLRMFGWIMKHRKCVRDSERLPEHYETCLYWSMIQVMAAHRQPPETSCQCGRACPAAGSIRFPPGWGIQPVPSLLLPDGAPAAGGVCQDGAVPADRAVLFRLATSTRLERAARAAPLGERLAWRAASRYLAGTTAAAAARVTRELQDRGVASSIDEFGELVQDTATADRVAASYMALADQVNALPADTWLPIDLSHLGLDIDPPGCAARLAAIATRLSAGRRIQVGAEDLSRADAVLGCIETVARQGLAGRLGATASANFRRTPRDLERLAEAGVYIRLAKGAYVEPADRALPYGEPTDIAYLRLAHQLAETQAQFALATHDGVLREADPVLKAQFRARIPTHVGHLTWFTPESFGGPTGSAARWASSTSSTCTGTSISPTSNGSASWPSTCRRLKRPDLGLPLRVGRATRTAISGSHLETFNTGHMAFSSDPEGFLSVVRPFVESVARMAEATPESES